MKPSDIRIPRQCPGCLRIRGIREIDWLKRKTDYCKPCGIRVLAGLKLDGESHRGTRLYNIWKGILTRCGVHAGGHDYDLKHYRDRGITCCAEWVRSFQPFHDWALSHGYEATLYIDRRDNDGNYSPENCQWVTPADSNRNTSLTLTAQETNKAVIMLMVGCSIKDTAKSVDRSYAAIYKLRKRYFADRLAA